MQDRTRVYVTGRDNVGWALDKEVDLTKEALDFIQFAPLISCEVIHTADWQVLAGIPRFLLTGRRIISHMPHDPANAFSRPNFPSLSRLVSLWVVRSNRSLNTLRSHGFQAVLVPDIVDDRSFHPIPRNDSSLADARRRWAIPEGKYLLGSFQRDTEGSDLKSPKTMKGPDIFAEIAAETWKHDKRLHVLLAGPRRMWIRNRLTELGIPFTFVGLNVPGDDVLVNNLPRTDINLLYNLSDLYLVASRMEGGPQAVLEAPIARCKILSTDVGYASEILDPDCIYRDSGKAVETILGDIEKNTLTSTLEPNHREALRHTVSAVSPSWKKAYAELLALLPLSRQDTRHRPGLAGLLLGKFKKRMSHSMGENS